MWHAKYGTHELETEPWTQRTDRWLPEKGSEEGWNEKLELADASFYTERKLLHRTGEQRGSVV